MTSGLNGHVPNGHATSFISTCLDEGMVGNGGGDRGKGNEERGGDVQVTTFSSNSDYKTIKLIILQDYQTYFLLKYKCPANTYFIE